MNLKEKAVKIIRAHGGTIRTAEAIKAGIHCRTLYGLTKEGELEHLSRGLYRLSEIDAGSFHDLAIVCRRVPDGVIALISALSFHEITTQIPHEVFIMLPSGARSPMLDYPLIRVHRMSEKAFESGVEKHLIEGVIVKIYNLEKTIVDCFKFRNKIGMDVVLEALKLYRTRKKMNLNLIMEYAKLCRVEKIIRPYLEATI